MNNPSTVAQESGPAFDFVAQLGRFAFNSTLRSINSNGYSSFRSNFLFFDSSIGLKKRSRVAAASLSLGSRGGGTSSFRTIWSQFNRAIRFHCDRIPIGFASVGVGLGDGGSSNNGSVLSDDGCGVLQTEGLPLNGVEAESPKKVLILMSDTGGGHRASAEAIKAAFQEEFGEDYEVFITDLWSEHTPWPFNQLPRSYNFLVKHGPLWKMTYYASAPRVVHQSNFAATSTFIARSGSLVLLG